ncbi:hypothetical protein PYCCODRAFT_1429865 [Trametes coccinea BRFM310]|uniref:C3H1-type domain-containing protein n=1 Tax=Trametes coccinea (strain BRFM310) TaxID=1353009 RepID=A0A1Y2J5W7_TRAC3|nr:hypothetical protein PYCCODRAFT_1429865 [Trametes coccinea BRFM310]
MASQDNHGRKFGPERRCHWFDSNGRPYNRLDGGLGCPRGPARCYFAHPTDLEAWKNARPGGDPPLHYLTDQEYRTIVGRHRSPPPARSAHPGPRPRSMSPPRRRSPPPLRRPSRERDLPSLVSRIRRRSVSRERETRQFIPRSSRSRSPGRGRINRSPPPPRGPRVSMGGPPPDGPRGPIYRPRSPVVFPKAEIDVPMRDVHMRDTTRSGYRREDSVASSNHAAQHDTPSRPVAAPIASSSSSPMKPSAALSQAPAPNNTGSASMPPPALRSAQSDSLNSMLESSTRQWQQISSAVAAASSTNLTASKTTPSDGTPDDASTEERAKIWSTRVEQLAAAVRNYNDCRSLENDVRDYQQLVESFSYQNLSTEDKAVIDSHLHALQSRLAEKNEELKRSVVQVANSKSWLAYIDNSNASPQEKGQQIAKEIQGLKASVSQLQSLFQTVGSHWEQVSKSLQSNRLNNLGLEVPGPSQGVGQSNALIAEAIVPKELEKIRSSIIAFEERLKSLEISALQGNDPAAEQLDAIVAENVQALILAATGAVQAAPPPPRPNSALTAHQLKMLETLQQNAAVAAQQVQQLSQKVTDMASTNEQLQTENSHLLAENAQLRQQLADAMVNQIPAGTDTPKLNQIEVEMRALNAAVVACLSQRPAASGLSAESLAQQIVPQITTSLPKLIIPELQVVRDQIQESLRTQQAEFRELLSHMSTTRESVDAIRELVDKVSALESPENGTSSPQTPPAALNGGGESMET